ncbi:hypothetical protein B0T11DRAFT_21792 [Plectosphaerella cucumerina]|uniref:Cell wall proline rich protein n=1 Tax=Plectosphaerella cucumerina TaxID=40658 RepID=A0A8K0TQE9_9PEZI|nr:hypothetical protein B0T11DRAFT_21792 [Plectosphaerella cucumerina]
MATAFGPEIAFDAPQSNIGMDTAPPRRIPKMLSMDAANFASVRSDDNDATSPRKMPPSPLPPFVFPAKAPASAPTSFSRATGRRPASTIEPLTINGPNEPATGRSGRPAALPSFSFNPGASSAPDANTTLLSPPMSPLSPHMASPRSIASPSRPAHGHRRGGSEFVGGSIRSGDSITVMGTSPTKSESGMASPGFSPPSLGEPPAAASRRHRHRRSAAISSHDLSLILQPPKAANMRGSSAPTSPADFGGQQLGSLAINEPDIPPMPLTPLSATQDPEVVARTPEAVHKSPGPSGTSTPRASRAMPRARVGFSDTLEFIPRPLSLVSSDASSTATARPGGHSVSGSLSSIMSASGEDKIVPAEEKPAAPLVRTLTAQTEEPRPSTAGAVLERSQSIQSVHPTDGSPRRRNSIPTLVPMPEQTATGSPSEPSPTKTPKRWSFFGLDPFSASQLPPRPRDASSGSSESVIRTAPDTTPATPDYLPEPVTHISDTVQAPQPLEKASKKKKKKKRKVQAWAGSILKGKAKTGGKSLKDPSQSASPQSDDGVWEPATTTETTQELVTSPVTPTVTITDTAPTDTHTSWKPRSSSAPEDDASFPVIDLDAALGPFNTPLPHNPEWEAAQKAAGPGASNNRRQLHSAQGMKGFTGPGMHYHRRAESAPEMVPFEASRFGINRFGSSSTMADVFEEDEEEDDDDDEDDDEDARTTASLQPSQATSKDVSRAPSVSSSEDETPPATTTPKSPILGAPPAHAVEVGKPVHAASMRSERSINSLQEVVIVEEPGPVEFRTESLFKDRPQRTDQVAPSPRRALGAIDLAPVEVGPLNLPATSHMPVSPYSVSPGSSFPSPRSPMSYDAHRISTAPSSVNEENTFQSLLLGEPGPEVRLSVDIPPSLTSSNSTMTRDSTFIPGPQPRARMPYRPDERPVSVGSAAFGRRRSSLASLSRLISSSHGERSKLSMEVSCETETEKKQKTSKTKRLSRMMQFWKPNKEGPST